MYQILNNLSPEITKDIFKTKINCYNTLNVLIFSKTHVKTVRHGSQTMSYIGPKIWELISKEIQQITTLNEFKAEIKIGIKKLCLPTLQNLPFTNRFHYTFSFNTK